MEVRAIRYAAMVSTLTFGKLVETYSRYLAANGLPKDAKAADYQARIREKKQSERAAGHGSRNRTKYDVPAAGEQYENLGKGNS